MLQRPIGGSDALFYRWGLAVLRIFLSFNSRDIALAEALRSGLHRLEPSADIFFSAVSISHGFWLPRLAAGIDEADAFLLLLGPKGVGPWQEVEYHQAFDRHLKDKKFPVIPIIADGGIAPGLPFLRQLNWVEGPSVSDDLLLHRVVALLRGDQRPLQSELWKLVQPYQGLLAMTEANADYFYGRSAETERVLRLLAEKPDRIPILVGTSGAGKSSVAQAGVISALKAMKWPMAAEGAEAAPWPDNFKNSRNGWAWLVMRPGNDPLKALAAAFTRIWFHDATDPDRGPRARQWAEGLRTANTLVDLIEATQDHLGGADKLERVLLYIDQAEELYSPAFSAGSRDARRFSELLAQAASDKRLLAFASLRGDYFDKLLSDRPLVGVHEQVNLPPLTDEGLMKVVCSPAATLGVAFDGKDVATQIASSAADSAGALPLLSYLMTDMWKEMVRRGDGLLKLPGPVINIGGVLAARAEEYWRMNTQAETSLKRLLTLKLTLALPEGKHVRRPALRSECTAEEWAVAEALADQKWRLVFIGDDEGEHDQVVAEVAHEALLTGWPRLAGWLKEDADFLLFKTDVERAVRRWRPMQNQQALLKGLDLQLAERWLGNRPNDLSAEVREFIRTSISADRKARQRAFRLAVSAAVLLAMLGAGLAWKWLEAWQSGYEAWQRGERLQAQGIMLQQQAGSLEEQREELRRKNDELERSRDELKSRNDELEKQRTETFSAQSRFLADLASKHVGSGNAGSAMLYALPAIPEADVRGIGDHVVLEAENALVQAAQRLQEIFVFKGHEAGVNSAVFSPDGRWILTASADHTARIWDAKSGTEHLRLDRHTDAVVAATFSRDGAKVVTASLDGTARIWDVQTGKLLRTLSGDGAGDGNEVAIYSAEFNANGTKVVTASADMTARIWDAASGQQLLVLRGHRDTVWSARFSPGGQQIVTASEDGTACVWNVETGASRVLRASTEPVGAPSCADGEHAVGHADAVVSAKYSRDGKQIITASRDWSAIVWDAEAGTLVARLGDDGHQRPVRSAEFSPDGHYAVTSSGSPRDSTDNTALVWSIQNPQQSGSSTESPSDSRDDDQNESIQQSRPPLELGQSGQSYKDALIDGKRGPLQGHQGMIWSASFSSNGDRIITASEDGTARIWDAFTGKELVVFRGHTRAVVAAAFSPDRKSVVTASADGTARIWNADKEAPTTEFDMFVGHGSGVLSAAFSPDGRRLATASEDCTARLWDTKTGRILARFNHADTVRRVAFSRDGRFLVTASEDTTARVWDAASQDADGTWKGKLVATLGELPTGDDQTCYLEVPDRPVSQDGTPAVAPVREGHSDAVWTAAFSPDGHQVLTASEDGTARLWDIGGRTIAVLEGHEDAVMSASFRFDGKRIVTASRDTTARVWDATNGALLLILSGHNRELQDAVFSPDGRWIATAAGGYQDPKDNTARVWDSETGLERVILNGHEAPVSSVEFRSDGRRILTASEDATARLWDAETGTMIAVLRGHTLAVTSARFSVDGTTVVTTSKDGTARLWNIQDEKNPQLVVILGRHEGTVWHAEFSPDGRTVVTSSQDTSVRLWDATSGRLVVAQPDLSQKVLAYSTDSTRVLTASTDGRMGVWDAKSGRQVVQFALSGGKFLDAVFTADGQRVAAIARCDPDAGAEDDTTDEATRVEGCSEKTGSDDDDPPWLSSAVLFRVWDVAAGTAVPKNGHSQEEAELAILLQYAASPDRTRAVVLREAAELWDAKSSKKVSDLIGQDGRIARASFSSDSRMLLTVSSEAVGLWNAHDGKNLGFLKGHQSVIKSASFSMDGRKVVTTSGGVDLADKTDDTARIWDISTGRQVSLLRGHDGPVLDAAFSPDGRRLVTASNDRTARLWNVETSQLLFVLSHADEVLNARFSPDGTQVMTAAADGIVRLWDAGSGQLVRTLDRQEVSDRFLLRDGGQCAELRSSSQRVNEVGVRVECARAFVPRCLARGELEAAFLNPSPPDWCVRMGKWPYHTASWKRWLAYKDQKKEPPLPDTPAWERWLAGQTPQVGR